MLHVQSASPRHPVLEDGFSVFFESLFLNMCSNMIGFGKHIQRLCVCVGHSCLKLGLFILKYDRAYVQPPKQDFNV